MQQFNTLARQSEEAAKNAIQDVPQIEKDITAALARNDKARGALFDAESDANRAKDIALLAQKTAEDASTVLILTEFFMFQFFFSFELITFLMKFNHCI